MWVEPNYLSLTISSLLVRCVVSGHRVGGGGRGDVAAPQIVGQTRQSSNIHFTVGQYWLIIKINRRNSLNIGGNMLYNSWKWRKNIKVIINYNTLIIIINYNTFQNNIFRNSPIVDNNFGKFAQEKFFDKLGMGKVRQISFRPPLIFPSRKPMFPGT
jgi:hypothetical protein